jgi:UrcA family protein
MIAMLAAVAAPGAAAAQRTEIVAVKLSEADLAMSDARLQRKIAGAVEEVCGSYAAVEPSQWPGIDDCRQSAWTGVRQQLVDMRAREAVKLGAR